jgi:hypothetical protein
MKSRHTITFTAEDTRKEFPLESILSDFSESLDALRDLVASTEPTVLQKQQQASTAAGEFFTPYWVSHLLISDDEEPIEEMPEDTRELFKKARSIIRGEEADSTPERRRKLFEELHKSYPIKLVDDKPALDFKPAAVIDMARSLRKAKAQVRLLYESSLMSLTSRSEWFIAQLAHFFYGKFEGALNNSEKVFSLKDLKELGGVEEARESVVRARVEDLTRGPFLDWLDFFRKYPKIDLEFIEKDSGKIAEIFKRRNLIVHNGANASRKYIEDTPLELPRRTSGGRQG